MAGQSKGGAWVQSASAPTGSFEFNFDRTNIKIINHELIEYAFGERTVLIEFIHGKDGVSARVSR